MIAKQREKGINDKTGKFHNRVNYGFMLLEKKWSAWAKEIKQI